jgi:regulator of protease activity HflC (stomatin/prohibitin superfamily)
VLRYEIRTIAPPQDILSAMEKQMRAEREKRAVILQSEAARESAINTAEGEKQKVIKASEARKQQQINEAEGQASAILAIANATSEGIRKVAETINGPGGLEAVQLRVAEQYIGEFGKLARTTNSLIIPANAGDISSMLATAMTIIRKADPSRQEPPQSTMKG